MTASAEQGPSTGAGERVRYGVGRVLVSAGFQRNMVEDRLAIDPRLEDLAGNSIARVFDRDLERDEAPSDPASESISFAL